MKTLLVTASAAVALLAAAPALAQPADGPTLPASFYGTLGYSNLDDHSDISAVTGRLGTRIGQHFGLEGEVSTGIATDTTGAFGDRAHVRLQDQYAAYAVGYLPVAPNADLFARVGLGATDARINGPSESFGENRTGVAYGVGGQYFFNGPNGVRADYTRMNFGPTTGDSNLWSLAYVRKF
jgi:outer membrane immunogenic protein